MERDRDVTLLQSETLRDRAPKATPERALVKVVRALPQRVVRHGVEERVHARVVVHRGPNSMRYGSPVSSGCVAAAARPARPLPTAPQADRAGHDAVARAAEDRRSVPLRPGWVTRSALRSLSGRATSL